MYNEKMVMFFSEEKTRDRIIISLGWGSEHFKAYFVI